MGMVLPDPEPLDTVPVLFVEADVVAPVFEERVTTVEDTGPETRAKGSKVTIGPSKRTK